MLILYVYLCVYPPSYLLFLLFWLCKKVDLDREKNTPLIFICNVGSPLFIYVKFNLFLFTKTWILKLNSQKNLCFILSIIKLYLSVRGEPVKPYERQLTSSISRVNKCFLCRFVKYRSLFSYSPFSYSPTKYIDKLEFVWFDRLQAFALDRRNLGEGKPPPRTGFYYLFHFLINPYLYLYLYSSIPLPHKSSRVLPTQTT